MHEAPAAGVVREGGPQLQAQTLPQPPRMRCLPHLHPSDVIRMRLALRMQAQTLPQPPRMRCLPHLRRGRSPDAALRAYISIRQHTHRTLGEAGVQNKIEKLRINVWGLKLLMYAALNY